MKQITFSAPALTILIASFCLAFTTAAIRADTKPRIGKSDASPQTNVRARKKSGLGKPRGFILNAIPDRCSLGPPCMNGCRKSASGRTCVKE